MKWNRGLMIREGVYRSGYPNKKNFSFLEALGIRTIGKSKYAVASSFDILMLSSFLTYDTFSVSVN